MLITVTPELKEVEKISPSRSRFSFEPLEPGFGYTLGNSLRRTLLSSIPGAAVTCVKFANIPHEFSTIEGVTEDVSEIILNVKSLVLSSTSDEAVSLYLKVEGDAEGSREVTAKDLTGDPSVYVHNPDLHIATLNRGALLEMELTVERGRGYVPASLSHSVDKDLGWIPVDQIYSPVLKVSYKVTDTRYQQRTDYDKLTIDVETKGSISPRDAMASAGSTLCALFGLAERLNSNAEGIELSELPQDTEVEKLLAKPIDELEFSVRSFNCLKRQQINTVGELAECNETDLLDIRNFGNKSIIEVKVKLAKLGLRLKDAPADFSLDSIEGYNPETGEYTDTDADSE